MIGQTFSTLALRPFLVVVTGITLAGVLWDVLYPRLCEYTDNPDTAGRGQYNQPPCGHPLPFPRPFGSSIPRSAALRFSPRSWTSYLRLSLRSSTHALVICGVTLVTVQASATIDSPGRPKS